MRKGQKTILPAWFKYAKQLISSTFFSFSGSNIFYVIDLIFFSLLKPNMLLMWIKFYNNINKTLEVIIILSMIVFFWVTLYHILMKRNVSSFQNGLVEIPNCFMFSSEENYVVIKLFYNTSVFSDIRIR